MLVDLTEQEINGLASLAEQYAAGMENNAVLWTAQAREMREQAEWAYNLVRKLRARTAPAPANYIKVVLPRRVADSLLEVTIQEDIKDEDVEDDYRELLKLAEAELKRELGYA